MDAVGPRKKAEKVWETCGGRRAEDILVGTCMASFSFRVLRENFPLLGGSPLCFLAVALDLLNATQVSGLNVESDFVEEEKS